MKLTNTYGYIKKDLDTVEKAINDTIQAEHPILRDASTHLLQAGGKRIRPIFVILSGHFGDYDLQRITHTAVTLELIHMASLVHDDVIDDADIRRNHSTVRRAYDNRVAMYTGDYILARSLENIMPIKKPSVHETLSKTIVEVCIGEIEQIKDKYDIDQNLRDYLRKIKRKTALLIATSCKLGALTTDAPTNIANKLYKFGYYIGMSYQIIDDILDFTSTNKELGKPTGHDLMQGNITLPVLLAKRDKHFNELIKSLSKNPDKITSEEYAELIETLKQTNAIKDAYKLSNQYLNKALDVIKPLPNIKAKQTLQTIATYIGKRKM